MGAIARAVQTLTGGVKNIGSFAPLGVSSYQDGRAQLPDSKYTTYANEGYSKNELVFAAIEALAGSAAEPRLQYRSGEKWNIRGPVIDLLNRPNPFLSRFDFFANVIMHRALAGNAYALIIRSGSGKPLELWLMRPDRVSIVPSSTSFISHYEYDLGGNQVAVLPPRDVIHFKTRNPLNDFYGMPPLMAAAGRVDIDNFMKDFVKTYFAKAGVPGGMLSIKQKLSDEARNEIKRRFKSEYGGSAGWHELIVLDSTEASFTPMTQNLGPSGLVVPDLDKINTRRILSVFGVPPALLGVDDANTSYASLEMLQRFFWDNTLAPLYKDLAGDMNLVLPQNFAGVDEIAFDMTDVRALREDIDKLHARLRSDLMSGCITIEEFRLATGREPVTADGTYLIPSNLVPTPAAMVAMGEMPGPMPMPAAPAQIAAPAGGDSGSRQ